MSKNNKFDKNKIKYFAYYAIAVALIVYMLNDYVTNIKSDHIKYSEFVKYLNENRIEEVQLTRDKIIIHPKINKGEKKKVMYTESIYDPNLVKKLDASKVKYGGVPQENSAIKSFIVNWVIPIIIFMFLGRMLFGKLDKKMGSGVMSFGKNTAKIYAENETGITFEDVAGQDEAKESLVEIVDFLHKPERYTEIGAKLPKGALLVGPPGTGKTLLAKAVAGEAKVPFFSLSGSSFVEMFVGMGAARVRDLFEQAQEKAPCIIFIDEIDAIGKSRDNAMSSNDEREQTLNQLLAEMDGFDSSKGVVILAATNRPEILDKALLRPGRFDRRVIVDRPDLKGREDILKVHSKGVKISEEVDMSSIAKSTPGAVGSDLANIINEAALRAVKNGRQEVIQEDLEEAVEVIIAGKEKKDRILSPQEKRQVAFHEVGHALVAALLPNTDPVHKITIVPRTMGALGYTMQLPTEDKYLINKEEMLDKITVMLGGRSAEEVKFNSISTGAANDIERATQTARSMVTVYGMTDRFDMMALESVQNRYLDGRPVQNCSAETAAIIDDEALNIIKECHEKAKKMLKENEELLNKITEKLLEKETLMGDEFMAMVKGEDESTSKGTEVEEKEKEVDENEIEDRILDESVMETKGVSDKSPIEE
ncbi:ATP-dependent zinc metalloprotease FtsH [Clostridium sporogenes]|uniref:ATP-dependent zinc metalloprotease FtsH n=1 Tax=Clostridium sporogenes TaxID=1509 RepID=UPI00024BA6C7|nr:ATP-dependent zinc metalloprotease FtsH [Clostridium sporogenes]EHN15836.1 ATP-dependent metalloprotease FtsH [Clostridium sporogenes PA 3679]MBA4507219.1 ATP-dependent metallopeptidase FtsH/Yme1/Tma family protein [Clostridium sporogenes]MCW6089827.1 ATP-dependent zinc metalloprotease FtsH [Clostridium sporogenes]MCW6108418.1 ATP-dependent zinc metalloprotease FtsH [Clostridium sporogenes]MDU4599445.1 ATP-dependent zinc metalloprotease FtsH [Clostridium sporogenes]